MIYEIFIAMLYLAYSSSDPVFDPILAVKQDDSLVCKAPK